MIQEKNGFKFSGDLDHYADSPNRDSGQYRGNELSWPHRSVRVLSVFFLHLELKPFHFGFGAICDQCCFRLVILMTRIIMAMIIYDWIYMLWVWVKGRATGL